MSTPFISVVIPTYNASKFLREALDSLLAQTFTDWEAICVNDGSTDDSLSIMQEYAAKDSRFHILDGPNGGYGKAMNRGMDAARGKYMAILEPDDFLPTTAYESLAQAAADGNFDILRGDACYFFDKAGERIFYLSHLNPVEGEFHTINYPTRFLCAADNWTGMFRLAFLREAGIRHNESPGASYQDTGFFWLTSTRAQRECAINSVVYFYRTDNSYSSIHQKEAKAIALMQEYHFIREQLRQNIAMWPTIEAHFLAAYLSGCIWISSSMGEDAKKAFKKRLRDDIITCDSDTLADLPHHLQCFAQDVLFSAPDADNNQDSKTQQKSKEALYKIAGITILATPDEKGGKIFRVGRIPVASKTITLFLKEERGSIPAYYCGAQGTYKILGIPVYRKKLPLTGEVVRNVST